MRRRTLLPRGPHTPAPTRLTKSQELALFVLLVLILLALIAYGLQA